jgi:hypothetical protein
VQYDASVKAFNSPSSAAAPSATLILLYADRGTLGAASHLNKRSILKELKGSMRWQ